MVVVEVGHCYCSVRSQQGNVVDPRHRIRRSTKEEAEKAVAHVPGWYYYWIDSCWPDDGLHRAISGCHVDLKGLGAVIPYCLVVVVEKRMMVGVDACFVIVEMRVVVVLLMMIFWSYWRRPLNGDPPCYLASDVDWETCRHRFVDDRSVLVPWRDQLAGWIQYHFLSWSIQQSLRLLSILYSVYHHAQLTGRVSLLPRVLVEDFAYFFQDYLSCCCYYQDFHLHRFCFF